MTVIRNVEELLLHNRDIVEDAERGHLTPEQVAYRMEDNIRRLLWWSRQPIAQREEVNAFFLLPPEGGEAGIDPGGQRV